MDVIQISNENGCDPNIKRELLMEGWVA